MPSLNAGTRLKRRWRSADYDQRRDLVIETAMQMLGRHGVRALTMRRVAQRLGIGTMTLYTYFRSQEELLREVSRRGFQMLHEGCRASSTLDTGGGWRGGARHYIQFALDNPHLYELMFSTPMSSGAVDQAFFHGGFQGLLDRVRQWLEARGVPPHEAEKRALISAGRYWIALHGLASLAIAGRLGVLNSDVDHLLDDLLERVAPQ